MTDDSSPLDANVLQSLLGRSLMLTTDFDDNEIDALLGVVRRFEALDRAGVNLDLLPNELGYAVFFDNSTRTKSAWAGAVTRLGMNPVIVDGSSTQVAHGETARETGAMLGMNAHAMGIRHDLILGAGNSFMRDMLYGITEYLEASGQKRVVPAVNLQCDIDHPTQALADLVWMQERLGDLKGKKIGVSWAYSPSYAKPLSVPQGLIMLMTRFGADVTLAHPEGYDLLPQCLEAARENSARSGGSFTVTGEMDQAFDGAHVVYPKSWGPMDLMKERVGVREQESLDEIEGRMLKRNAKHTDWICDERRMATTADALYMHCLPADIGDEVEASVMERFRLDVAREAQKKVYVIMALLAVAKVDGLAGRIAALEENR